MPLFSKTYGGVDYADMYEKRSAERIGERIKKIRQTREMSRAQLGSFVELDQNRIQQYENGKRKPKIDLLKRIAMFLGVNTYALMDPASDNPESVMFMLFELEEKYGLRVEKIGDKYCLQFGDGVFNEMNGYLKGWYEARCKMEEDLPNLSDDERKKKIFDYNMYEWTYPEAHSIDSHRKYYEHPINRMQEIEEDKAWREEVLKKTEEFIKQQEKK